MSLADNGADGQRKEDSERDALVRELIGTAKPAPQPKGKSTWTERKKKSFDLTNPYGDQR